MRRLLAASPVIPALRRPEDLSKAVRSTARVVFILCGDINTLGPMVAELNAAGKRTFLHLDLAEGFGSDRAAMRFIAQQIKPFGILTTKSHLIRLGKDEGLTCVQRVFIFDSQSLATAVQHTRTSAPAAVEALPAVLPDWALHKLVTEIKVPVIAGGLIRTAEESRRVMQTGVAGISIGDPSMWSFHSTTSGK